MNYTELSIQLKESPVLRELLVFKLAEFGFESFQDLDGELKAFVLAKVLILLSQFVKLI